MEGDADYLKQYGSGEPSRQIWLLLSASGLQFLENLRPARQSEESEK